MFNDFQRKIEVMDSNPSFPHEFVSVPQERDGKTVNGIECRDKSNISKLDGLIYQDEVMSLRAKLNLGIPLHRVTLGSLENDPTNLLRTAQNMEQQISSKLDELRKQHETPSAPAAE